jgi:sulfide:quinone oxidoreductase
MTSISGSSRHHIVIAGGGIAGLEALIALRMQAPEHCRVTLVSPGESFGYRPLGVEEPFGGGGGRRFSLGAICNDLRASHARDGLAAVDAEAGTVRMQSGADLAYDSLIIALGAIPYPAFGSGVTFDRERDAESFDEFLVDVDDRFVDRVTVVVPERVGWTLPAYELALAIADFGSRPAGRTIGVTLVTHEPEPLAAFGTTISRTVADVLAGAGIEIFTGREALVMSEGALVVGSRWITTDRIVALPRLAGPRPRGVACDIRGFILVDEHGRVPDAPGVYAVGDGADHPIKQGGLAAQQADAAVADILWRMGVAPPPRPPAPVLRGILRTSSGTLYLEADLGPGRAAEGSIASWTPLWPVPGRVASRWLASYLGSGFAGTAERHAGGRGRLAERA